MTGGPRWPGQTISSFTPNYDIRSRRLSEFAKQKLSPQQGLLLAIFRGRGRTSPRCRAGDPTRTTVHEIPKETSTDFSPSSARPSLARRAGDPYSLLRCARTTAHPHPHPHRPRPPPPATTPEPDKPYQSINSWCLAAAFRTRRRTARTQLICATRLPWSDGPHGLSSWYLCHSWTPTVHRSSLGSSRR